MIRENHFLFCIIPSLLLVLLIHDSAATTTSPLWISRSCPSYCGDIAIPYPFGIGNGCYLNHWYEIICKNNSGEHVPFLRSINMDVVNISLIPEGFGHSALSTVYGSVRIKSQITSLGCSSDEEATSSLNVTGSPFFLSDKTRLLAVGCNNKARLTDVKAPMITGCESACDARNTRQGLNMSCDGYRCCETFIPVSHQQVIGVKIESVNNDTHGGGCRVAFLTDKQYYLSNIAEPERFHAKGYATVELGWYFDMSDLRVVESLGCVNASDVCALSARGMDSCICKYRYLSNLSYGNCMCNYGYRGNPYVSGGCKEIDECQEAKEYGYNLCGGDTCVNTPASFKCVPKKTWPIILGLSLGFGLLILTIVAWWLHKFVRRQKNKNQRKKFFKRNGGLLLQHQLTAAKDNIEKTRIFSSKEIEKATEKFSENRILGQGGQGTVYKGMLINGRIVAVKKSKLVDEDNLEEFINEVVILSRINHRNIVKLLGCFLETEVPILVYEFIPNGNLFEHLHDQFDDYIMSWEVRLHIAIEIAGAVSYLHLATSIPVYHRDIKSTNILLDEKYRAKVSDFGTSRSVTIDHTHLTTMVSGTAGYVDPEYFQSSQFTDKSDVYSFGVVLVELITGEKPLSFLRPQECRTLATHFNFAMKENKLFDIIDPRIKGECEREEVMAVATLAKRCLNLNRKKRPNMREVSMELERIRVSPKDSKVQIQKEEEEEEEENDAVEISIGDSWNIALSTPTSELAIATSTYVEPLVPHQTW